MSDELRILYVEDVETDVELVLRILRKSGITCTAKRVETEADFRRELQELAPNIVLSDFTLPTFDGASALTIAKEQRPDAPFIFVSGTIGEERAIELLKRGATDYVLKTNLQRLAPAVRRALRETAERAARRQAEWELRETKERLDSILASLREVVWAVSVADRRLVYVNPVFEHVYQYSIVELLTNPEIWLQDVHPDDRNRVLTDWQKVFNGTPFTTEYRVLHRDGTLTWVIHSAHLILDPHGTPTRVDSLAADITERKQQEEKIARLSRIYAVLSGINSAFVRLRDRDELFQEACRIAVEHGNFRIGCIGVLALGTGTVRPVVCMGAQQCNLTAEVGALLAEDISGGLIGQALREKEPVVCNDIEAGQIEPWKRHAKQHGYRSAVALPVVVGEDTTGVFMLCAGDPDFFDEAEMRLLRELAADVSFALEVIEKEERLNYLAYYDALTGLPNRSLCYDRINQLARRTDEHAGFAVIALDLERFRLINDTFGRNAGDSVLKQVAERLRNAFPDGDTVARVGADYFGVVLTDLREESEIAHVVREKILATIGRPFTIDARQLRISARAGVALFPNDGGDADTLCKHAETAVKRAKASGERVLFYTPQMQARIADRLALENDLRRAIKEEQFVLYYQPKIDFEYRRIRGLEALIRWNHPEKGLVCPAEFISVLEETGMILDVGRWVLERAVADYRRWQQQGLNPPSIEVNVSPIQLRQRDFVAQVQAVLERNGSGGVNVGLELTESVIMEDVEQSLSKLNVVRELGVSVAIDDFGTGFSSLSYLSKLPVSAVKIDRSFTAEVASSADNMSIVSAIINLAHSLNLRVIAEGVETDQQAQLLKLLRCDEMQGFLFSRPLPPEQTEVLLLGQTVPSPAA